MKILQRKIVSCKRIRGRDGEGAWGCWGGSDYREEWSSWKYVSCSELFDGERTFNMFRSRSGLGTTTQYWSLFDVTDVEEIDGDPSLVTTTGTIDVETKYIHEVPEMEILKAWLIGSPRLTARVRIHSEDRLERTLAFLEPYEPNHRLAWSAMIPPHIGKITIFDRRGMVANLKISSNRKELNTLPKFVKVVGEKDGWYHLVCCPGAFIDAFGSERYLASEDYCGDNSDFATTIEQMCLEYVDAEERGAIAIAQLQ